MTPIQTQVLHQLADVMQNQIEVQDFAGIRPDATPNDIDLVTSHRAFVGKFPLTPHMDDPIECVELAEKNYIELIKYLAEAL